MAQSLKIQNAFNHKSQFENEPDFSSLDRLQGLPELTRIDKNNIERDIMEVECYEALCKFKNNKSPGSDSLSKYFFLKF